MKKHRLLSFILVCAMMLGLFGIPAVSASEPDTAEKTRVLDFVKEFMAKRARYEWAFENNDYAQYFDTATRSTSNLAGNFAQTMTFYQDTRKLADHYIENLEIDYVVHDYQKTSQGYQVNLSEFLFYDIIDGNGMPSIYEERYTVQLVKRGENLKITDVDIETDTFYQSVKETGFDSTAEIAKFQNALQNNGTPMTKTVDGNTLMATRASGVEQIPYNRNLAAQYARIFSYVSRGDSEGSDAAYYQFYNPYFGNYDSAGGDCANFASQCLYYGFYGRTDNRSLITSKSFPMDTKDLQVWWTTGGTGNNHSTNTWVYASGLAGYPAAVAATWGNESGIVATTYENNGGNIVLPMTNLKGSVFILDTDSTNASKNDHAIFINDAPSNPTVTPSLSLIYYCAHSAIRSNVRFSSTPSYSLSKISTVIIPSSYTVTCTNHGASGVTCANCGYSRIQMQITSNVFPTLGTAATIQVSEVNNRSLYQISGRLLRYNESGTNPGNVVVSQGSFTTVNNAYQISKSHNFSTTGLYFVEITVTEYSTSIPKIFTFPIRVLP